MKVKYTKVENLSIDLIESGDMVQLRDGSIYLVVLHESSEEYFGYAVSPIDGTIIQISTMYNEDLSRTDGRDELDIISICNVLNPLYLDINRKNDKKYKNEYEIIISNDKKRYMYRDSAGRFISKRRDKINDDRSNIDFIRALYLDSFK